MDAEDIAQESLAKAFQQLDRFDFQYQFSTWLYTIAFRLATDFTRRKKRRPKFFAIDSLHADVAVTSTIAIASSGHATEVVDDVWKLARTILVESQYTILWLKYGEGLPIKEIASVIQRTQIVVRVQLHRARGKLSKEIHRMDREQQVTRRRNEQI